jgi:hypothetical protein
VNSAFDFDSVDRNPIRIDRDAVGAHDRSVVKRVDCQWFASGSIRYPTRIDRNGSAA